MKNNSGKKQINWEVKGKPQNPTFQPITSEYHQLMHSDQKQTFQICNIFSLM